MLDIKLHIILQSVEDGYLAMLSTSCSLETFDYDNVFGFYVTDDPDATIEDLFLNKKSELVIEESIMFMVYQEALKQNINIHHQPNAEFFMCSFSASEELTLKFQTIAFSHFMQL